MKHKNVKESEEDIELLEMFNHFKKLELEKFYLGIYLSGHPLEGIAKPLNWEEIDNNEDTYNTLCIVSNVKPIVTKKGDAMAFITLSLIDRELEVVCFPGTWEKSLQLRKGSPYIPYNQIIKEGLIVRAKGKAEYNKSSMSYFLNDISIPLRHNKHLENFLLEVEAEYGVPVVEKEMIQMPVFNIDGLC